MVRGFFLGGEGEGEGSSAAGYGWLLLSSVAVLKPPQRQTVGVQRGGRGVVYITRRERDK